MSKAGQKLIEAAKEAVEIAECGHQWMELEYHPSDRRKWLCWKCRAIMYTDDGTWPNR